MSTTTRGFTIGVSVTLVTEECCARECGVVFAMPSDLRARRLSDHQSFYCPNGHSQSYTGPSDAEKLAADLKHERERLAWYSGQYDQQLAEIKDLTNSVRAQKAAKTRIRNRIQAGVCPDCRRNFENVARHMASKHPHAAETA